ILSLAVVPFGVGLFGRHTVDLGVVTVQLTGDRIMLFAAGLLAAGVGIIAYRQMDDGRPVPLVADVVTALRGDTTARRRLARGGAAADRLESESLDFHQRVRETFLALAESEPDRYLVLDARRSPDELAAEVRARVAELLSGLPLQTLPGGTERAPAEPSVNGH